MDASKKGGISILKWSSMKLGIRNKIRESAQIATPSQFLIQNCRTIQQMTRMRNTE